MHLTIISLDTFPPSVAAAVSNDNAESVQPDPVEASSEIIAAALRDRGLLPLAEQVCHRRGVTLHELCSRLRTQNVSRARQELWWQIRHHPQRHYSYPEIGRLFRRDHSTIKCAVDAFQRRALDPPPPDPLAPAPARDRPRSPRLPP